MRMWMRAGMIPVLVLLLSCAAGRSLVRAAEPLRVFVSVIPQGYFVERIGGERVEVHAMVKPGANPATYEPKPNQMVLLAGTRVYFATGVPFEGTWLGRFASMNPGMRIVRTDRGIEKRTMEGHRHADEKPEAGHSSEAGRDPHVWLSPPLVMLQARRILEALIREDPSGRMDFEANYKRLILDLIDLDAEIRQLFADKREGGAFLVFHPAWGYFAEAYGLWQIPVEVEGKEPKPSELSQLIDHARKEKITALFVQPQFSTRSAQVIAEAIGGKLVVADPLAGDWMANLRQVARSVHAALP
ncbi:Periplasmic solute binding protein [uncultured Desulfatiglans sp.]|uniref:Periplasmic solute binding protein n=1 Tax=Uncultured Desulfatiglans sp. TaxID=1748965 RepID=A0A653A2E9_UNCDX|nr:Periplasmic solute binding protein [uncultured Desulfatiglans sp.]